MKNVEKGQHVRFIHPRTGVECAGKVVRVDRNDRPTGWNVSIVRTEDEVLSVPNSLIRSFPEAPASEGHDR